MPVKFKTTKVAQRAKEDPLLYEMLRDFGTAGEQLAAAVDSIQAQLNVTSALATTLANNVYTGTYTPTVTAVANVANVTAKTAFYSRIFNVVHVAGYLSIDPTAATTLTKVGVSLPIPSALLTAFDCIGQGSRDTGAAILYGGIVGDAPNARAEFQVYTDADVAEKDTFFTFSYIIK